MSDDARRTAADPDPSDAPHEIDVEPIPEQVVVCLGGRGPIAELRERGRRVAAVLAAAGVAPAGPLMARYPQTDYDPADLEFEVGLPIAPRPDGSVPDRVGDLPVVLIPAHHAMVARHRGPLTGLAAAHRAIAAALDDVGYRRAGPVSEVYLAGPEQGLPPSEYLTEVRYPYAR
jgi:effector-binding domain-containing protein